MSPEHWARSTFTTSLIIHGKKERGPISIACCFGVKGYTLDGQGYRPVPGGNVGIVP